MVKKTITIKEDTWRRLSEMKLELSHRSLDKTINYLLYELNGEKYEKNGKIYGDESKASAKDSCLKDGGE